MIAKNGGGGRPTRHPLNPPLHNTDYQEATRLLILHAGTNDATTNTSKKIVDDLLILKSNISKQLPSCRIVLLKPIIRHDDGKTNLTIRNVNKHLSALQSECIENANISSQHLGRKGLHLNPKGKGRLALNFIQQIRKF